MFHILKRRPRTFPSPPCIPIPPYWPHARRDRRGIAVGPHRRPPYTLAALQQLTKNCKVRSPTSRRPYTAAHASQISMRPGFPYGPCSHTFPRLPNTTARLQKSRHWFRRDQRPAPQIPNQSCPTGTLNLRHISANQAPIRPAKSYGHALQSSKSSAGQATQIIHTCEVGGWLAPLARTSSRVCAHLHGHGRAHPSHGHTCTAMATSLPRARLRRDQRGRFTQIHASNQLTQIPCADEGGMGTAPPRDAAPTSQWGPAFKPA